MYANRVFLQLDSPVIKVSSFQGILNKGFHCMCTVYVHVCISIQQGR